MPFFGGGGGDYHIVGTNIKGGNQALPATIGTNNMGLGNGALQSALGADNNIAIGNLSLNAVTTGNNNISIGYDSFPVLALGAYVVAVGGNTGAESTGSQESVIIGYGAFSSNLVQPHAANAAQQSVIIGTSAVPSGDVTSSVYIGAFARQGNAALSTNAVVIGANTLGLDSSVVIGAGASGDANSIAIGLNTVATANQIIIGDASYTSVQIGGITLASATGALFPSAIIGDPGTEGTGIVIGGVTYDSLFKVSDISSADIAQSIIHRHSTTWEPIQVFARSNSNGAGHGAVVNGMLLSSQYTAGWTGTEYNLFGRAGFEAAATGAISDASSPGDFVIATTPDGGTLPIEAMRVTSDKKLKLNGQEIFPLISIRLDKTLDQIIPFGGVLTSITFQSQTVTVGGAVTVWNAINPERITIPPGYTKAKFIGQLRLDDAFANQIYANHITKNGVLTYSGVPINNGINVSGGGLNITASSEWLSVAPGDYFTMAVINTSATTNNNVLGSVRTWFGVELMP